MKSAIIKSLLLYVVGFSITVLIYYTTDNPYAHGPNFYHITFILTICIGAVWLIIATIIYINKANRDMLGHIYVNGIAVISFVVYLWMLLHPKPLPGPEELDGDEVQIGKTGDSTFIYLNEGIIYLKVADSVHLDLRDSTMMSIDLD